MDICKRLSFLFGLEEYVKMRREVVILRENLMNQRYSDLRVRFLCSGSLGEGIAYPMSDDDVMVYKTDHHVVKSQREATQRGDLLMVPSEYSPGYCLLFDVTQTYRSDIIHAINGRPFLSSSLWKEKHLVDGETLHGPCGSRTIGPYESDLARCLSCSFWPDIANNWISRNNSKNWPTREMIQKIVMNGCHVVAIGDQTSPFCQHEWRVSFTVAERTLMHSFNHVQFLTYNVLRLCLKRVIERKCPTVLCSYFMKTTLFYTSENTLQSFWKESNIEACFKTCLSALYDYVGLRKCPNYFIPEYNMIKRKVNDGNCHALLDTIRHLYTIGIVGSMHLCEETDCFIGSISRSEYEMKQDCDYTNILSITLTSIFHAVHKLSNEDNETQTVLLSNIIRSTPNRQLLNIFFRRGNLFCGQKLMDHILRSFEINKKKYYVHKSIGSLFSIGYHADLTSGKLTVATYMYLMGKTKPALSHIRRLLSEYPPYAIDGTYHDIRILAYMEAMCGRGYTIDYKVRHAHAPEYYVPLSAPNALPSPFWILIFTYDPYSVSFDPLTYAYFLECLCSIRLKDQLSLRKSIRCLVSRLDDLDVDNCNMDSRMCVGVIKYVQGNSQSACRWLGSAYIMKNTIPEFYLEKLSDSVMTYIACLLNQEFRAENLTSQTRHNN